MALIVETGAGLLNSQSYVTAEEVRAYAASRGKTLPVSDTTLEQQILAAQDYVLQYEERFQGFRRTEGQALSFPRTGVVLYARRLAEGVVPQVLKDAVSQLVVELQTRELQPTQEGRVVTKEQVGPLATEYAVNSASPSFPIVDTLLSPLLRTGSMGLSVRRV